MTDRESLWWVMVVLYLVECLFWVKRGAWVFRTWIGRFWMYRDESEFARNDHGGVHWAWPLPPLGVVHVCRGIPFSIGPEGILAFKAECLNPSGRPRQTGRFVKWTELKTAEARGKALWVDGMWFWAGDSIHQPAKLAAWLMEVTGLSPEERLRRLRAAVEAQYDVEAFESRKRELHRELRWLNVLCPVFLVFVLGAMPVVITTVGWFPSLYFLLPSMFGMSGLIAWRFARVHRQWYPDAGEERFKLVLLSSLIPASAARARDPLTRGALEEFHPLCAASVLLTPGAFRDVSESAWRDLCYPQLPACDSRDPSAAATEQWYRSECRVAFRRILDRQKLNPDEWVRPPKPSESVHVKYCERCHAQFTDSAVACGECGGRGLLRMGGE